MTLEQAIADLRRRNEPVPKPMRLPTQDEVAAIERTIGVNFHKDYRKFLLEASDVVVGTLEPAQVTTANSHDFLLTVLEDAKVYGVPSDLLPICEDNGAFYCIKDTGEVCFWGVDFGGYSGESWPSLGEWIEKIWIGENA